MMMHGMSCVFDGVAHPLLRKTEIRITLRRAGTHNVHKAISEGNLDHPTGADPDRGPGGERWPGLIEPTERRLTPEYRILERY